MLTSFHGRLGPSLTLVLVVAVVSGLLSSDASASSPTVTIYVDGASAEATDDNPGTESLPVQTISRAVEIADGHNSGGRASVVRIAPAVYREQVTLDAGLTAAPLTLEATGPGAVVSGADVFADWSAVGDGSFAHRWNPKWGFESLPAGWPPVDPLLRRREIVVFDGQIVRQVLDRSQLTVHPAAFFVDEAAGVLYLRPPSGIHPLEAEVEVATRQEVLVSRRSNLTIRGLEFTHAATRMQRGALLLDGGANVTVEDSLFTWNNWSGFWMNRTDSVTLRRNRFDHNGVMGFGAWRARDVLFEDNSNSYNNRWRGMWANFSNWEDGSKLSATRRTTFRRHIAVGNWSSGLWFDGDVQDVLVEDAFLARNKNYGIFLEISPGPFLVRNSLICENELYGIQDGKADDVTFEGNKIFHNGQEQWTISGAPGGVVVRDWETGVDRLIRSQRWTMRDNLFVSNTSRLLRNNLSQEDWEVVNASLRSDNNLFYSPHSAPFTLPGRWLNFSEWQRETGQDRNSRYEAPASALACEAPPGPAAYVPQPEQPSSPVEDVTRPVPFVITNESHATDDGEDAKNKRSWSARITLRVTDSDTGQSLSSVTLTTTWNYDESTATCTTDSDGRCTFSTRPFNHRTPSATLSVIDVQHPTYLMDKGALPLSFTQWRTS